MTYNKIVTDLLFNYFLDMRKKDINKRQRAELLATYLEENDKSQRELAKELGIPHSTIQDWLMINRISDEDYQKYVEQGMTDTAIYRMLRNNKKAEPKDFSVLLFKEELKKAQTRFRGGISHGDSLDLEIIAEIRELINILNRVLLHAEKD